MRDFAKAFRGDMRPADADHDDAAVWLLLSNFLILAFDFEQPGSLSAQYARERCAMQLAPQDLKRAGDMLDALHEIALATNAAGGDLDAEALCDRLTSLPMLCVSVTPTMPSEQARKKEMTTLSFAAKIFPSMTHSRKEHGSNKAKSHTETL